ncbi:lysozyme inhibitor LprI family protein [Alkalinema pantanalense CENA528]|uniref:lysozyme inhibitor LprI family protein n=1 Tax=Alkalinema pantanalense TaxID=1620705 RepID=UPI003D6EB2DA
MQHKLSWSYGLSGLLAMGLVIVPSAQAKELPNCRQPKTNLEKSICQASVNCDKPVTQLDMNFCSAWDAEVSDRQLNRAYKQLRDQYRKQNDQHFKKRDNYLVNSQLAWIKYRDTHCQWIASRFDGGSAQPMLYSSCIATVTQQRTNELQEELDFEQNH